ncbi:mechanosensitive ion channel family protein [Cellvibrio mixtus]|uniref:mechanosensitive ion channel family protein n=1 Tax=Cellvibrio mixtus TaxID=39650 RepID=UPI0005875F47|nr:mechanosensitive ion channel domain-containing protein [Cellvibrio mixtus]
MLNEWLEQFPELTWLTIAIVVFIALAIIARIVSRIITHVFTPFSFARDILERIRDPLHLLIPLIGLQTVSRSAPQDMTGINAINHITLLAIIGAVTWLGLRAVDAVQQLIYKHNPINISDNLHARRIQTQTKVLVHTLSFLVILFGLSAMLMTFPIARQFGTSLLASAGVAGLVLGFAAKPVLGNLIAGLQIAITQPIRLDDVVIVAGEWGRIEEITGTYVVVRIWDDRRLIVPLQWFIENPFQNWTRKTTELLGFFYLWLDYSVPIEPIREEATRLCKEVPQLWDGRVCGVQVTDTDAKSIQIRVLISTTDSSKNWDLRCYLRENLINFIMKNYPDSLPQLRAMLREKEPPAPPVDTHPEPERQPPV